jgi:WD40 repeat protein
MPTKQPISGTGRSPQPVIDDPKVFISYSRTDGEAFAKNLSGYLEMQGIPLWQERGETKGGRDRWLQFVEAAGKIEFMVLVMTPEAMASPLIRKEWRYARQKGICVFPVKGAPDIYLDYASLPRSLRAKHFYDLDYEFDKFIYDLNTRCREPRVPFMVTDLPDHYVQRPAKFKALLDQLLEAERKKAAINTIYLRGADGCGKTTLARALCHDERVQEAFGDGILWVTLGKNPGSLIDRIKSLVETLSGKWAGFADVESASNHLSALLADRDILLVIDDIWDYAHLKPFLHGGPRCSCLITTSNSAVLPKDAKSNRLDAMQESEALRLVSHKLPGSADDQLQRLCRRLGRWPLLLKMINAALIESVVNLQQSLSSAISHIDRKLGKKDMTAFDARSSDSINQAVEGTLSVSLERLDENEKSRFDELAIFPVDADIPIETIEKLWMHAGLGDLDTEHLCERLFGLSLLWHFDPATRTIKLHAVIQDYLRKRNKTRLPLMNARFLDAYGIDQWAYLPADERYLWQHLAYHLAACGDSSRLKDMLLEYGWLKRKLAVCDVDSLISDYDYLPDEEALSLVQQSLRLSANQLTRDGDQLAPHLICRLNDREDPEIIKLLTDALEGQDGPWLEPLKRSLKPPGGPLLQTLEGHGNYISAVAISPDGKRGLSGSDDRTLKLWNLATGKTIHTLEGHRHYVRTVAISPDGRCALSGSSDKTLKLWDLATGKAIHTLQGHGDWVRAVAISPDGQRALSGSSDHTLKLWDLVAGDTLRTLEGHRDWVSAVAISPDGKRALSGSDDKTLRLWDLATGKAIHTLVGHRHYVRAVAISPDGKHALSGSDDKTLRLWDLSNGKATHTLEGHGDWIRAVAIAPDGKRAISGSYDHTLKLWDLATGKAIYTFAGHGFWVRAVAISPDGLLALSGSDDKTLKLWDLATDKAIYTLEGHREEVSALAISPDGRHVLSGSGDATLKLWDLSTGKATLTLEGHNFWVTAVAISPDGKHALSGSGDETLKLWDLSTGKAIHTLEGHSFWVTAVAISPDGRRALSGSSDHTLKLWNLATGQATHTLEGHGDYVCAVAISPDGRRALSGSGDETLKLWDLATGKVIDTFEGHSKGVRAVAISPDGQHALSGSSDHTLKLWDLATGKAVRTLEGHSDEVSAVGISPDGQHAFSGSSDHTLKLWNLATGKVLASFIGESEISSLAVSPCGRIALGGEASGHLHFFKLRGI